MIPNSSDLGKLQSGYVKADLGRGSGEGNLIKSKKSVAGNDVTERSLPWVPMTPQLSSLAASLRVSYLMLYFLFGPKHPTLKSLLPAFRASWERLFCSYFIWSFISVYTRGSMLARVASQHFSVLCYSIKSSFQATI